jgi:peptidoglycan-N-acetylglucosamine deacetylase
MNFKSLLLVSILNIATNYSIAQKQISISIDDPNTEKKAISWQEINSKILETLSKNKLKAALFVCGVRIDSKEGQDLLNEWDKNGHLICNHSYSHLYYNSKKNPAFTFIKDFEKCDQIISTYKNYSKLFRFPYLKEGNTKTKIDSMRQELILSKYKTGHVSIDASDWYIDLKMEEALKANPEADLSPYRDYYINHIKDRAKFYDSVAQKTVHRSVKHVLLLHHSLLNALFLNDLIAALKKDNWKFIDAKDAYNDEIYNERPDIIPCGESIIWQLAKQKSTNSESLRYPAEDSQYEEKPFEEFLKNYTFKKRKQIKL